jgi:hypothetical protein
LEIRIHAILELAHDVLRGKEVGEKRILRHGGNLRWNGARRHAWEKKKSGARPIRREAVSFKTDYGTLRE